MANNYISQIEQERIIELQRQGRSYRQIGKEVGRDASSVYRIVSGERGTFWKSHKTKTWRCTGCGSLIRDIKCRACSLRASETSRKRNEQSAKNWYDQIRTARKQRRATVLEVINEERKNKPVDCGLHNESS
jgi:hypothetical protein